MSQQDFFVSLSERRLTQSVEDIKGANTRAMTLLSLLSILMSGVWALSLKAAPHSRAPILIGFGLLTLAMVLCGGSLLLPAQYDSPKLEHFYEQYFGEAGNVVYSVYFTAVIGAIAHNHRVFRLKSGLTATAIMALLSTLVIMALMPIKI